MADVRRRRALHLHAGRHGRALRQAVPFDAGLADRMTFLSAFTVDETTLPAQQQDALGFFGAR